MMLMLILLTTTNTRMYGETRLLWPSGRNTLSWMRLETQFLRFNNMSTLQFLLITKLKYCDVHTFQLITRVSNFFRLLSLNIVTYIHFI
jgi:hypothetical protein